VSPPSKRNTLPTKIKMAVSRRMRCPPNFLIGTVLHNNYTSVRLLWRRRAALFVENGAFDVEPTVAAFCSVALWHEIPVLARRHLQQSDPEWLGRCDANLPQSVAQSPLLSSSPVASHPGPHAPVARACLGYCPLLGSAGQSPPASTAHTPLASLCPTIPAQRLPGAQWEAAGSAQALRLSVSEFALGQSLPFPGSWFLKRCGH